MDVARTCYAVPRDPINDRRFDAVTLESDLRWKISPPESLPKDEALLRAWEKNQSDSIASYENGILNLPAVMALAATIQEELEHGFGVAWVRGMPLGEDFRTRSLLYLAVGAAMGKVNETYGRLYDVVDSGDSYQKKAIPVSQTRESTGLHTDSSRLGIVPDYVGLLCLRQGQRGGGSKVVSAVQAHEALRCRNPVLLEVLYRDFIRDVVTPGAERDPMTISENRFPIFQHSGSLTMRYMRYWIESGHRIVGAPLLDEEVRAMDALDEELSREAHCVGFYLSPGDMLWVANRVIAHDRDAYTDAPEGRRWLQRQWVESDRNVWRRESPTT